MLRWLTAGESHGPALSAIIEGIPAHVLITSKDIDKDLERRRLGFGRGARQNFEADKITITGGVRLGALHARTARDAISEGTGEMRSALKVKSSKRAASSTERR